MAEDKKKHGFFWVVLVIVLFSAIVGYANYVQSNLLPAPMLDHILISNLKHNEWKGKEKPLFPPQTGWGSSFEYSIALTTRWKPDFKYEGYAGGGQLTKLEQQIPFITFFIACRMKQNEKTYVRPNHLHLEEVEVGDKGTELTLWYYKLDEEDRKDFAKRTGHDNCISFRAFFTFRSYEYDIDGIFPTTGPEFSVKDPNVMQVRGILIQYVNDMLNSYEPDDDASQNGGHT
jgi:hypothetical protein